MFRIQYFFTGSDTGDIEKRKILFTILDIFTFTIKMPNRTYFFKMREFSLCNTRKRYATIFIFWPADNITEAPAPLQISNEQIKDVKLQLKIHN